jgi:hypothetical protein
MDELQVRIGTSEIREEASNMVWNRNRHRTGVAPIAAVLVALVATVTMTSGAAAESDAGSQRVVIASKLYPERSFVFTPLTAGALKRDSGTVSAEGGNTGDTTTFTFKGRRGILIIRELKTEWVDVLNEEVNGVVPAVVITRWNACAAPASTRRSPGVAGAPRRGSAMSGTRAKRAP